MSRFHNNRDTLLWDEPSHLQRRDRNDPAREISLFKRLFSRRYLASANSGKQEAVLKIVSTGMGKGSLSNIVEYVARTADYMEDETPLDLEDELGNAIATKEQRKETINNWGEDFASLASFKNQSWKLELKEQLSFERDKLKYYQETRGLNKQQKDKLKELNLAIKEEKVRHKNGKVTDFHVYAPKDTTHIILSIGGEGHDLKRATEATRRFLRENFESQGYRYLFVAHADTDNLHFHVVLKNKNELTGKNIQFDKADLFTLRHDFAYHLQIMGIKRVATLRRDRVVTLQAIQEQKEQLFERHKTYKEKQSNNKPINVQKYQQSMLKRTEYLLNNTNIELDYSKLTPERAKKLRQMKFELTAFHKELTRENKNLHPEKLMQNQTATLKQLQKETQTLENKQKPKSKRQTKNMRKYLVGFEKEITEAIKHFKMVRKALPEPAQVQKTDAALKTLQKLHKQTVKLRRGYGWKLKI